AAQAAACTATVGIEAQCCNYASPTVSSSAQHAPQHLSSPYPGFCFPISHHATSRSSHLGSSHRGTAMHLGPDDVYHWVSFPIQRGRFCRSRLLHVTSIPCFSLNVHDPSSGTDVRKRGQQSSTPHHDNNHKTQAKVYQGADSSVKRQAEEAA
ncbi:hypothetical protein CSAL01_08227, partial [Colletotrichum salicis]